MPPPKKQPVADPYADMPEAPAPNDPYAEMPDAFAAPASVPGKTFRMHTPEGEEIPVAYDRVMDAYRLGYKIHPDDRIAFADAKVAELSKKGQRAKFNPNTDLPEAFDIVEATSNRPWYKPNVKAIERGALDLLPMAGGIVGGLAAGGAGLESGPADIAIAAAGAGAGGAEGEHLREEANEILFPYDYRMSGKEKAKYIAMQGGLQAANEATGRAAGKYVLGPAEKYFSDTALGSEKAGFRMRPSEARGTRPSVLETYPQGSIFTAGQMGRWREAQNAETEKAVRDLADTISKKSLAKTGSREEAGNIIRNGIEAHMAKFRTVQNAMYDKIDKLTKGLNINPSRSDMVLFAKNELNRLKASNRAGGETELTPFTKRLQSIVDNNLPTASFSAMKDLRASLLAQARDYTQVMSGPERGFLDKLAGIIDKSMEDSLKKSGRVGLVELWRNANAITREEHETFEQKLIKKLAAKENPEAIALVLRGNSPGAISSIGIQETRDAMSVIPKELIPRVQKQILLDTLYEASEKGTQAFSEKTFSKRILQIGDERGEVLFGNNWPRVRQLSELLNKINENGGLTGATLSNPEVLRQVGRLAAESIGVASGAFLLHSGAGRSLAAGVLPLATEAVLWKTIATAITHPAAAAKFIKGLQMLARYAPYAATGAGWVAIDAGRDHTKSPSGVVGTVKEATQKVDDLKDNMTKSGWLPQTPPPVTPMQPQTPSPPPPAPAPVENNPDVGPQSNVRITHVFNPRTGQVEAA